MPPLRIVAFSLVLLPLAEIAAFVLVASFIGYPGALALLLLVSAAGFLVLRRATGEALAQLRAATRSGDFGGLHVLRTRGTTAFGGILLLVPGFITGLLGVLTLIPQSRQRLIGWWSSGVAASRRPDGGPTVVDLSPQEWERLPTPQLGRRKRRRDG